MAEINIDSLSEKFQMHLSVEGNQRTIFSGKFGTGKTYFLHKFFKGKSDLYNTFIINPVNYVVSSNEDIFELIKADIVNDLFFTGKIEFTKAQKTKLFEKLFLFSGEKPEAVIKFVSSLLSKFNPLFEFTDEYLKSVKELKKAFTKYSKELTAKEKNRQEELAEFVESLEEKKGSIYEHNYITKVINTFLEELRGKEKENVLIIDDLDRIDPEHIFRILNILSAHNNHHGQENKFAFDHIIVVCDLQNIEKTFFHKYGIGVDFEGYIDKFFSTDIFFINNQDAILIYVNSLNEETRFTKSENELIIFLLNHFVKIGSVTVRKLMKLSFDLKFKKFDISKQDRITQYYFNLNEFRFISNDANLFVDSDDFSILKIFLLFSRIFGSVQNLKKELSESKYDGVSELSECKSILCYLALQHHISTTEGEGLYISIDMYYEKFTERDVLRGIKIPEIDLLDLKFILNTSWSNGTPYNGEVSYFSKTHVDIFNYNGVNVKNSKINSNQIKSIFSSILNKCIKRDLFNEIGI
ncbi:MAG: P-loop NTPase fold protein [Ferruginibacter sp.]